MSGLNIIGADERLAERRGVKALIAGPAGVGKTSLLRTLDAARTLFIDIEAGDLSVQDVPVDTIRVDNWPTARDLACRIGGPNSSFPPTACYSGAHFEAVGGALDNLDRYDTIFVDSITAVSRLSFRWAEQQPEAFSERTGKKDVRGAYGLHAREMIAWLQHLQHARGTGRELPGIVDQIITMQWVVFGEGAPTRAFVCTSPNPWGYPAKDRAGRLEQIEEPHLGKLITKLIGPDWRKPFTVVTEQPFRKAAGEKE